MGLDGLDFGFLWVGILDSNGIWVELDWLVGLAWWAVVVVWWVVGCLVVFAMGLLGFWWVLFCFCFVCLFVFFFWFLVLVGFWWVEGSGGVVVIVCLVVEKVR